MSNRPPAVTIPHSEMRVLASSHTGYEYQIFVGFPDGYVNSAQSYPTLYLLDAQWSFGSTVETARLLAAARQFPDLGQPFPDLLVVGIGFPVPDPQPYRKRDYVPAGWLADPGAGGAEDFLRFIREDLIPFIGSEYRADPDGRGLMGDSLGGLFGLYALLCRPGLFRRYIIGSPWLIQDDPEVFGCESDYAAGHDDLPARVFMGAGSLEPESVIRHMSRLGEALQSRGYPNLRLETHIFEGETHLSVLLNILSGGLKAVYRVV